MYNQTCRIHIQHARNLSYPQVDKRVKRTNPTKLLNISGCHWNQTMNRRKRDLRNASIQGHVRQAQTEQEETNSILEQKIQGREEMSGSLTMAAEQQLPPPSVRESTGGGARLEPKTLAALAAGRGCGGEIDISRKRGLMGLFHGLTCLAYYRSCRLLPALFSFRIFYI